MAETDGRRPRSVVHLNTHDILGGAAKVAWRLAEGQRRLGHRASLLVGYKRSASDLASAFPIDCDPHEQQQMRRQGLLYYEYRGSHRLPEHPQIREADVVHLHNLHGDYFNPLSLADLGQGKPLVWTLHDMQAFTGHCAHAFDCDRWTEGCGACPDLGTYPQIPVDTTARLLADKTRTYRAASPWLVTPSEWLRKKVERSVMGDLPVETIPNGIDIEVFRPQDKAEIRRALNIPIDRLVVGAVAHEGVLANPWKGGRYTLHALEALRTRVPDAIFLNIGARSPSTLANIVNVPHVGDDRQMARLYAALDLYLYTSIADNCPLVVLEAMASGVPLVTFGTGGIPELVRDGVEGIVTPCKDLFSLMIGLRRIAGDAALRERLARNARSRAVEQFDHRRIVERYDELYRNAMARLRRRSADHPRAAERTRPPVGVPATPPLQPPTKAGTPLTGKQDAIDTAWLDRPVRVSVLVSTYNSEAFIRECLEDLEAQTIASQLEIIVVDAASPQRERDIVEEFQRRYGNITYIRTTERIGVYAAWNVALQAARGVYLTPFSTNDRLGRDAYETLARALDEHPDVALVYGDTHVTTVPHETFERHTRLETWAWPEYNYEDLLRNCRVGPHPMWRRSIHDDVGVFDESYLALGDQEFWLRLGERHRLLHIPRVTGLYWRAADALSNRADLYGPENLKLRRTYLRRYAERRGGGRPHAFTCSIIIPVWNKRHLTEECLTALARTAEGLSFEVIIVDNASTDDTPELLTGLSGDVQIITNSENLGFARACNQGARAARGQNLVFLNNDTIPQPGWLHALLDEVERHPATAVVGSKLLYADGRIQHAGVAISRLRFAPFHLYVGVAADLPAVNYRREFQSVTGACMLVRRDVYETVEGFDEAYKNGFEDVDFCLKVRLRGGRIVYRPDSVLYHLESQTPGRKAHEQENFDRFRSRWACHWWLVDEDALTACDGLAYVSQGQGREDTAKLIRLNGERQRASWRLVGEAQRAIQQSDWRTFVACLAKAGEWPNDVSVLRWGAAVCQWSGLLSYGRLFEERLGSGKDSDAEHLELAKQAIEAGRVDDGRRLVEALVNRRPDYGEAWLVRGILAMQRFEYAQAADDFRKAAANAADQRKAGIGLAMAASAAGDHEAAWTACAGLRPAHPDDQEILHWLLRAGTAAGKWGELEHHLGEFAARNPAELAARLALAGVLLRAGKHAAAKREFERIRLLNPAFEGLAELGEAIERGVSEPASVA